MPYVADATDVLNPLDATIAASTAPQDFRAIKLYMRDVLLAAINLRATITNLALKAPIASPAFTGNTTHAAPGAGVALAVTGLANNAAISANTGISVGNAANTNATVLDWYEEGNWTPSLGGTTTYTTQQGTFTRIGNRVLFDAQIDVSVIGTGSTSVISGLPYAATFTATVAVKAPTSLATAVVSISGSLAGTQITLACRVGASSGDASPALFGNNTGLNVTGSYRVLT